MMFYFELQLERDDKQMRANQSKREKKRKSRKKTAQKTSSFSLFETRQKTTRYCACFEIFLCSLSLSRARDEDEDDRKGERFYSCR